MREWPHSVLFETGNTKVDNAIDATPANSKRTTYANSILESKAEVNRQRSLSENYDYFSLQDRDIDANILIHAHEVFPY